MGQFDVGVNMVDGQKREFGRSDRATVIAAFRLSTLPAWRDSPE